MTAVRPAVPVPIRLPEEVLAQVDERLTATDALLARAYPGEDGRRQPVHTSRSADQYPDLHTLCHSGEPSSTQHCGIEWLCASRPP